MNTTTKDMAAATHHGYATPDELTATRVPRPSVGPNTVLVKIEAASINPLDWHLMTGTPYMVRLQQGLRNPKRTIPGVDLAGRVEAVGDEVTGFAPGDDVFGTAGGTLAEFAATSVDSIVQKPAALSFEQAAAIPIAGITALEGLRDKGHVEAGQHVLINGAGGGVGTFAVQIAKAMGAEVTGVCSTGKVDLVRSIGADHVIDYTADDFTAGASRYDLLYDNVGNRSLNDCRRCLTPNGRYLMVSGSKDNQWVGPLGRVLAAMIRFSVRSQSARPFLASESKEELLALRELVEAGQLTPVVGNRYDLADAAEAMAELETGHARGKIIVTP